MTSFLTSLLSLFSRRRTPDSVENDPRAAVADAVPAIVWITSAGGSCTWVNDEWLRFSGRTREEALGDGWLAGMHPDDAPHCMPLFEAAFDARRPVELEYRQRRHDGVYRRMLSRGVPRFDGDGRFGGYAGVALDMGDVREAEQVVVAEETVPDLHRKQILLVDRDPDALERTAAVLRERGAEVTTARSAAEAILALLQHHDLIITDAGVPVAEGVTLAQQLRQTNGGLPAIVLRKPVDALALTSEIATALSRSDGA